MAIDSAVAAYLEPSASAAERTQCVQCIVALLTQRSQTALSLVQALQACLISDDAEQRLRGTSLLNEVIRAGGPHGALAPGDLQHLATFMTARLSDWSCTEPAAQACTALLQLGRPPSSRATQPSASSQACLAESDCLGLVRSVVDELAGHVQELTQRERQASLQLMLTATQVCGVAAARSGLDLAEACVAAIDGEKDPRCLLLAFSLVQAVARVYHQPGVSPLAFQAQAPEVVEVLSCYFPLTFTPPKNDPHSRAQLACALEEALAASPFLATWAVPLVLEKLSSTYRPAKEDALSALTACCRGYGPEALRPHLPAVWQALRTEVLAPAALGLAGSELAASRTLASRAAACLHTLASLYAPCPPASAPHLNPSTQGQPAAAPPPPHTPPTPTPMAQGPAPELGGVVALALADPVVPDLLELVVEAAVEGHAEGEGWGGGGGGRPAVGAGPRGRQQGGAQAAEQCSRTWSGGQQ
ncbi:Dos2-interacting transcription regulator of RNA-Pol-II-domain-containing protein [Haematococcus lacustris]